MVVSGGADAVWKECTPFNNLSAVYVNSSSSSSKLCVGRNGRSAQNVDANSQDLAEMLVGDGYEWLPHERGDDIPAGAVVLNANDDIDENGVCQPIVLGRVSITNEDQFDEHDMEVYMDWDWNQPQTDHHRLVPAEFDGEPFGIRCAGGQERAGK